MMIDISHHNDRDDDNLDGDDLDDAMNEISYYFLSHLFCVHCMKILLINKVVVEALIVFYYTLNPIF